MQYVRAAQRKKNHFLLIFIIIIVIVGGSLFLLRKKASPIVICSLSQEKYDLKFNAEPKEVFEFSDYFFYGDVLNIKNKTYALGVSDTTTSKSIILVNLCNDEEHIFTLEQFIDRHLDLSKIEPGMYQMYINESLVKKSLTTKLEIPTFNTITKNNKHKTVSFIKNKFGVVHLKVEEVSSPEEKTDIFLEIDYGHQDLTNTGSGAKTSLLQAEAISRQLNMLGYRSRVLKNINKVYGENGSLSQLYRSHAKHYFVLAMDEVNAGSGVSIENSHFSSKNIVNSLMYQLIKNTSYKKSNQRNVNEYGVLRSWLIKSELTKRFFDSNNYIRESGGYATQAGMFSKMGMTNTFAKNNKYGVNTLFIMLGFTKNDLKTMQDDNFGTQFAILWDLVR